MALELRDETLKYNASQRDQVMFDPGIEPIVVYALILAVMADEQKSSFKDEHDRQQFFGIVRHLVDHCALLNTIFARRENFQGFIASTPDTHFNTFARSEDCAELRQAVERIFGVELLRKITHNQQVDPQQVGEPIIQVIPTNSLSYLEEQR
jgi:hypothetical protein